VEKRIRIWCITAVLTLTVGGAAYAQRPATEPTHAPQPQRAQHRPTAPIPPPRSPAFKV
jgi:hypothetical protein